MYTKLIHLYKLCSSLLTLSRNLDRQIQDEHSADASADASSDAADSRQTQRNCVIKSELSE